MDGIDFKSEMFWSGPEDEASSKIVLIVRA
jgi:hypothetical protein